MKASAFGYRSCRSLSLVRSPILYIIKAAKMLEVTSATDFEIIQAVFRKVLVSCTDILSSSADGHPCRP